MKTTPFTTSAGEFLAVDTLNDLAEYHYSVDGNKLRLCIIDSEVTIGIFTLPGKYELVCKQSEVTEEIANGIVGYAYSEKENSLIDGYLYDNFSGSEPTFHETALESFDSLMDSLELYLVNPLNIVESAPLEAFSMDLRGSERLILKLKEE